jgi:hypothetical protein
MPGGRTSAARPCRSARVVWAEDGEEWIDTVAFGWTGRNVHVHLRTGDASPTQSGSTPEPSREPS